MPDNQLSVRELVAATSKAYPCLTLEADQWHEVGYFFDPIEGIYACYAIDRKEQQDEVERFASAEELLAAYGADQEVVSWVGSFRLCVQFDERLVYYPSTRVLQRFPVAGSTRMTVEEGLESLDGRSLSWLRAQLA